MALQYVSGEVLCCNFNLLMKPVLGSLGGEWLQCLLVILAC